MIKNDEDKNSIFLSNNYLLFFSFIPFSRKHDTGHQRGKLIFVKDGLGSTVSEWSLGVVLLGVDTLGVQAAVLLQLEVFLLSESGESPLLTDNDLLSTWELKLGTSKGLDGLVYGTLLASQRHQNLTNTDTGTDTQRLSVGSSHSCLESISSSTRKHFVDTENVERLAPNSQVESFLTRVHGHVLVAGNTSGFESFTTDLLILPTDKMDACWKDFRRILLHTHIIDTDLGVWHTTAVPRLRVWLVLDLPVAPGRS